MRFRRNNGSPVSFFAFQDVITGVAGVMLIVVLLLIIGKRRLAAPDVEAKPGGGFSALKTHLAQTEQELQSVQKRISALRQEACNRNTAQQESRKIQVQSSRNQVLSQELAKRKRELSEIQTTLQEQTAQLAALPFETAEYLKLLDEERQLRRAWRSARLSLAPESSRDMAVLDLARSAWRWERRGEEPLMLGKENASNPTAAWQDLESRLKQCDPEKSLLIVAVRPSAGGFITPLLAKIRAAVPKLPLALEPLASETEGGITLR